MNLFTYHLFSGISRSINCRNPFVAFRGVAYFLGHLQSDWGLAIIQSADLLQRVQRMQSTVMARNGAPPPTYRLHHPLQVTPTAPRIWSHSLAALLCLRSFFRIVRVQWWCRRQHPRQRSASPISVSAHAHVLASTSFSFSLSSLLPLPLSFYSTCVYLQWVLHNSRICFAHSSFASLCIIYPDFCRALFSNPCKGIINLRSS